MNTFYKHIYLLSNLCSDSIGFFLSLVKYLLQLLCLSFPLLNYAAQSYNTMIRRFPQNIIASIFSFNAKGYFKASEGAENAPKVEF